MLVYSLVNGRPILGSVGFVVLVLGAVMVAGGLSGLRILSAFGALLAIAVAGMWTGLAMHHYNTPQFANAYYLNPAHLPWSDMRMGAWLTICGAIIGLLSASLPYHRRPSSRRAIRHSEPAVPWTIGAP
jgi:hypothetical protein